MTRLQKKCLLAAACTHLLLVVALLCSGFVRPRAKPQDTQVIEMINPTDLPTSGETPTPTPPPPAPSQAVSTPPTPPTPPPVKPPEPQPEVAPVVKTPEVEPPDKPEQPNDPESDVPKPPPKKKHEIKLDELKVVTRTTPKVRDASEEDAKAEAKEQQRRQDQKNKEIKSLLNNLNRNLSTAPTEFHLPGNDNASRANYLSIVVSKYYHAWISPSHMTGESAMVTFAVTIARDGSVVSSHIENRSGDASVDEAVQRLLNRVTDITPFPPESTDRERTYHIDFNATRTSQ